MINLFNFIFKKLKIPLHIKLSLIYITTVHIFSISKLIYPSSLLTDKREFSPKKSV